MISSVKIPNLAKRKQHNGNKLNTEPMLFVKMFSKRINSAIACSESAQKECFSRTINN